jgi:hypothetical protein
MNSRALLFFGILTLLLLVSMTYTIKEGFQSGSGGCVFDARKYSDAYPDLKDAFGYNEVLLKDHFIKNGINEGRSPCGNDNPTCSFNAKVYADNYDDLKKAYGYDTSGLKSHYTIHGINEGRSFCKPYNPNECVFDARKYADMYPDVRNAHGYDPTKLREHYSVFGINEGRTPCGTTNRSCKFNAKVYADKYNDLKVAYGYNDSALKNHYSTHGINEGRSFCTKDASGTNDNSEECSFNAIKYADKYPDLKNAYGYNEALLKSHYTNYGINEGRSPCGDDNPFCKFDAKKYADNYGDVKHAHGYDAVLLKDHYIKNGINEGRYLCLKYKPGKCPAGAISYTDRTGNLLCCNGKVTDNTCSGKVLCAFGSNEMNVPQCSSL